MLKFTLFFYFVLCFTVYAISAVPPTPSESYTHKLIVDDDQSDLVQLYWKVVDDEEIIFEVHAKTTGWIGVGISSNGGMAGSDIAIGWIDDASGKAHLRDCHARGKETPLVDKQQDWFLLSSSQQIDGYTIIKMKRKLRTCDEEEDQDIQDGSTFMIFAWHKDDPKGDNQWLYHDSNRRVKTALLLNYKEDSVEDDLPSDVVHFDIVPNVEVPSKDTLYYCETFKLPAYENNLHLIKFEMMINKTNRDIVHHYDIYECDDDYVHTENLSQECGMVQLPEYIGRKCSSQLFISWSIGGQYNYSFPKVAGYPIIKANKTKYVMITIHYDNPRMQKGRFDNSGVRLYFTPTLREHDLGLMTLGGMGSNGPLSFTVPPLADSITFTSVCYPECTNMLPEEGINAVAGIMHTHLLGRKVRTTLVRDNKIVQNLLYNPHYDFNYQYIFDMKPIKIHRGDILITQCTYSSKTYNNFTYIGFSTRDEMCYSFMYFYPATQMRYCHSAPSIPEIKKFYKSLMDESFLPKIELNETSFDQQQVDIAVLLATKINGNEKLAKKYVNFFESQYEDNPKCAHNMETRFSFENRVRYTPAEDLTLSKCRKSTLATSTSSSSFAAASLRQPNSLIAFGLIVTIVQLFIWV